MRILVVPKEAIGRYWDKVKILLVNNKMQDYTMDDLLIRVSDGRLILALAIDGENIIGACVYGVMPNKTAHIFELGGKGVVTQEVFSQLCSVFKSQGMLKVQATAQPAAARLYSRVGMRQKYTVVGTDL